MPSETSIEKRNKALIAFAILTGARDSAIASFKIGHVDIEAGLVHQDGRDVKTKFSKSFDTVFFEVGDEIKTIFREWIDYLVLEMRWGDGDPLFPSTQIVVKESQGFHAAGLKREHWASAGPIRRIFRESFQSAGLPTYNPHSFRDTLTSLGFKWCKTPEDFKAWSKNMGHESVLTTLSHYGDIRPERQAEVIRNLGDKVNEPGANEIELVHELLQKLKG